MIYVGSSLNDKLNNFRKVFGKWSLTLIEIEMFVWIFYVMKTGNLHRYVVVRVWNFAYEKLC